jgi:hypothetical protein
LASTLLILVLLGGSICATVAQHELWPFSHYPMYSVVRDFSKGTLFFEVAGVYQAAKNQPVQEIILNRTKALSPYKDTSLQTLFGRSNRAYGDKMWGAYKKTAGTPEFYERKLQGLFALYERNHKKPVNRALPDLTGLRLYATIYTIHDDGTPVQLSKKLIHETPREALQNESAP